MYQARSTRRMGALPSELSQPLTLTSVLCGYVCRNVTLGVFSPACYIHTDFTLEITINSTNYKQAFRNFFYGTGVVVAPSAGPGGPGAPTILADDCGVLCNPSCNVRPIPPVAPRCECRQPRMSGLCFSDWAECL